MNDKPLGIVEAMVVILEQDKQIAEWIAYADRLVVMLEIIADQSRDWLLKQYAEQGLRIVRPNRRARGELED